jgi:hypothetical protein
MVSRKLIILSLLVLPLSVFGENASDYMHRGAQKYIFGQEDAAKAEVATGLTKFPEDPELRQMAGLFHEKKKDQQKKQDQKQNQSGQKDKQDQQQSGGKDQQDQQQQSKDGSGQQNKEQQQNEKGQSDSKNQSESQQDQQKSAAGNSPSPTPGQEESTPSPSPGAGDKKEPESTPTPGDGESPAKPSPSPGENEGTGENGTPSPTPGNSPGKKLAGDIKGANDDSKANQPPAQEEAVDAEAEKEGEMSERQAEALLQSMKDEEARVQLDERKARRHVYKDW